MDKTRNHQTKSLTIDGIIVSNQQLLSAIQSSGLTYHISKEIILDRVLEETKLSDSERVEAINNYRQAKNLKTIDDEEKHKQNNFLSDEQYERIATRGRKIVKFREEKWGNLVNSIYLKRKEEYETIKFHQLKCSNSNVMQEIYFRIKDDNVSWESIARQLRMEETFVVGPVLLNGLQNELKDRLRKIKDGNMTQPFKIGNAYMIAQVIERFPAKLDETLKQQILREEFERWFNKHLKDSIKTLHLS